MPPIYTLKIQQTIPLRVAGLMVFKCFNNVYITKWIAYEHVDFYQKHSLQYFCAIQSTVVQRKKQKHKIENTKKQHKCENVLKCKYAAHEIKLEVRKKVG